MNNIYNRAGIIHENFISLVRNGDLPEPNQQLSPVQVNLRNDEMVDLFESQLMSRHLDLCSRALRNHNESFYTIGGAGHEGNAVQGKVFRYTDMALLHYRSGALMIQRSKQVPGETPLYDMLLSFVASSDDPVSGGRHKVLGSRTLFAPPQTSTIASHLPRAMGLAWSIDLAKRLGLPGCGIPQDSIVLCNFGDASANHATALGAINAAAWTSYQNSPMPIVFICEDNGLGISVPTPPGWIAANFSQKPGIHYLYCDGLDLLDTYRVTCAAVDYARTRRKPVFLHMRVVRLMGHAGSDVETGYRPLHRIEQTERQDPLLYSARILIDNDILSREEICELYQRIEARIARIAACAIKRPKLTSVSRIMSPITAQIPDAGPVQVQSDDGLAALFGQEQRLLSQPQHMARLINIALAELMLQYPELVLCGEDIGIKGGVYSVTSGLHKKFGASRVIDTLLDEQSILGLALGMALNGFVTIPEIQFLAYVHNAEDQIRGEAATLSFFSSGQYHNPVVIRIAGLAYQKGFGGHFHNDNSLAVFRDIPGLIIACPSNGADAVRMLRTCINLARTQKRVIVFIEPIALYMTRDLHARGDDLWASTYTPAQHDISIPLGRIAVNGTGTELCIVSYANGYYLALQAARQLQERHGIQARVIDLRWLAPLNAAAIMQAAKPCKSILIVDECRRTGSISEALYTLFTEHGFPGNINRVTAEDSFIPLGDAAHLVLPDVAQIITSALTTIR
jgi:2-oxoisovalerate dehydrogenase E1 component